MSPKEAKRGWIYVFAWEGRPIEAEFWGFLVVKGEKCAMWKQLLFMGSSADIPRFTLPEVFEGAVEICEMTMTLNSADYSAHMDAKLV